MRVHRHLSMRSSFLLACVTFAYLVVGQDVRSSFAAEIVILKSANLSYYNEMAEGFRAALPPKTSVKEYDLGGSLPIGQEITRMLRADPPSLVFTVGLKATLAAKLELPDTPVVFSQVLNPELYGLPSHHMTGIRVVVSPDQQLSTLRALLPQTKRIGLLYDKGDHSTFLNKAQQSAHSHGFILIPAAVSSESDVPGALHALLPTIEVLWVIQDRTVLTEESVPFLLKTLLDEKIPMFTFSDILIRQGALGGLVLQPGELGKQAGAQAIQLLRGNTKSLGSLLDPQQPQLVLNLHVAEYLGITAPDRLIRMAGTIYGTGTVAQQSAPSLDVH